VLYELLAYAFVNFVRFSTHEAVLEHQKRFCFFLLVRQTSSLVLGHLLSSGLIKTLVCVDSCVSRHFEVIC